MEFKLFAKELSIHGSNGYHLFNKIDAVELTPLIEYVSAEYIEFMKQIGSGRFYNGSLQLFKVADNDFKEFNKCLHKINCNDFLAISYNGITEGCFCLKKDHGNNSVYWVSWINGIPFQVSDSFRSWIEKSPKELFNREIYKGFKSIKDVDAINYVIIQRKKINVILLSYTKELVSHPNEAKKYLKRYNKVFFEVVKAEKADIKSVTIKVLRSGSVVGNDNVEYVTIDVENIVPLKPTKIEVYLFDPFNIPFESIICLYAPEIDLDSTMRVAYKEIIAFL